MATLALAAAGAAVGSALLPAGVSVLGATLTGAAIGSQVGALAGAFVDQSLFGASGQTRALNGPRLSNLHVTGSTEGAPIPRVYGRMRLGGQVIWATDFVEEIVTTKQTGSGKGRSSSRSTKTTQTEYRYFANVAVAIAEGPITSIGRVWADGRELDLSDVTWRLHYGDEGQAVDSLIAAREGRDAAPAYRGVAYIVFEHLALAAFGNRLPQLSFEVSRSIDALHEEIRGIVLIPGSGEFVYAPEPVTRLGAGGARVYENIHTRQGGSDWAVSIDQLQETLPNAQSVSLVVSWFGTDLRAGVCEIRPGVEIAQKDTAPINWSVAGINRDGAHLVSLREGRPAYGGTPSDSTVITAITDLNARGFRVTLTPFILMDIADANGLPNPLDGAASQPSYPWRGRITIDPAPGLPGTPDKTAAAAAQIASFVGSAQTGDFAISDGAIVYSGPAEWSWRRQVLHCAWLAKAAGGVDAFVIGSELRGLTHARDGAGSYPFVAALVALAADVKSVLGASTRVTYAADWSEYFGHQPTDGSGDVYFHLDALWASADIDAIGIDLYWPLADWRDDETHADKRAGARSIYDLDYLASNIAGGEGFDWYYADASSRRGQRRTPITDGAGKPWVFRYKDLRSWWSSQHFDRAGGAELGAPTAWVPHSKPVWIMECGCPATDKGANQPNVFVDPKSAESALPYFSSGRRDDLMQRQYLQALIEAFDPSHPRAIPGLNPVSPIYGGTMIDPSRVHVYAWDARPYPVFPNNLDIWGDGANWRLGHWLNGRIAAAPLSDVVGAILDEHGFVDYDVSMLDGVVGGYVVDRIMSAREALQPLELAFFVDAVESEGRIVFRHRGAAQILEVITEQELVDSNGALYPLSLARGQESDLPAAAKIAYVAADRDYAQAIAEARRLTVSSGRVAQADLAIALDPEQADAMAATWLFEAWAAREKARFTLAPSALALEPGDLVSLRRADRDRLFRITEVSEHGEREIETLSVDPTIYRQTIGAARTIRASSKPPFAGLPLVEFLDLPILRGDEPDTAGYVAASAKPWPGGIAFYASPESTGFELQAIAGAPATTGTLLDPLPVGPAGRFDRATRVRVQLDRGELGSVTDLGLLSGANIAAIRNGQGDWEVLQFQTADLVASSTYMLSGLLRAQAGTDSAMVASAAGARFVLIDASVARIDLAQSQLGLPLAWRYGPSSRDLGEESYATRTYRFVGLGRRPLSPVHVRGRRTSAGDLTVSWIRRTRLAGDSWDSLEVPLGEDSESYEVDIVSGATVMRTLAVSQSQATYTAAQQMADFGVLPGAVVLRVHQLSPQWGRGTPKEATV